MFQDIRLAMRTLRKSPVFALTTVAVLALGIGANTAIFSLVNQLLLKPAGVANPERVVSVQARYEKLNLEGISLSAPDFKDVEQGRRVFDCAAAVEQGDYNLTGGEMPERLRGASVSVRWFDVFQATPLLGRTFSRDEDQPNANKVVVLAHAAWLRLFGGDASVVGRTIDLNGQPYKVVGVMKPDFRWPRQIDIWVPMGLSAADMAEDNRFNEHLAVLARVRADQSFEQADAYVKMSANRLKNQPGEDAQYARDSRWGMFVVPFTDFVSGPTRKPILILMGAVAFVLLIACSNVAGLMVARTAGRAHEIAVRGALGARRWHILRQTLAESIVLTSVGAVAGVALARAGIGALLMVAPEQATSGLAPRIDTAVLVFTLAAAVVSAILSVAAPAWQSIRVAPYEHIKGSRSATAGAGRQRLRSLLVISETALALVLLVGAGLLLRSLGHLQEVTPGFDPRNVMTAALSLPRTQYSTPEKQIAFYRLVTEQLAAFRGVQAVGVGGPIPFGGSGGSASFEIEGRAAGKGDPGPHGNIRLVTPGYFSALRIPLEKGRVFADSDRKDAERVAIVDENLVREYWPNENPIGKRIRNGSRSQWATVVGVVGHVKHSDLAVDPPKGTYYFPLWQAPMPMASIVVRTSSDPQAAAAIIRRAVHDADPRQPVHSLRSMEDLVWLSLAPKRLAVQLLTFFAAVALLMSALGLHGVISYSVTERTSEIAVRVALGAENSKVLWLIVRDGLRLVTAGVVIGVVAALFATTVITSQLYGVTRFDPATFGGMIAMLLVTTLVATWIPARRALGIDPVVALRSE